VLHDRVLGQRCLGDLFPADHSLAVAGDFPLQQLDKCKVFLVLGGRGLIATEVEVRAWRDGREVGHDIGDEAACGRDVQVQRAEPHLFAGVERGSDAVAVECGHGRERGVGVAG
jgi:hypothetical protein